MKILSLNMLLKTGSLNIETYLEGLRLNEHSFMTHEWSKVMRITSLIGLIIMFFISPQYDRCLFYSYIKTFN